MDCAAIDLTVPRLGECRIPSPMHGARFVGDGEHVLYHSSLDDIERFQAAGTRPPVFELAGPREHIYFDPSGLKAGIVTCGGLCPGLNDVIRAIVLSLYHHYGVKTAYGFRYGYEGLSARHGQEPLELTPGEVDGIQNQGGTILGASRGPQEVSEMVDTLERLEVRLLFAIGGDGTLRGAHALAGEVGRRGLEISIIGIPKTIDNDISCMDQSFGFATAVTESRSAVYAAHSEASGARNGVGLVKLMGRHSGFIAAMAALASGEVNFCLVPEVPFSLEKFLAALQNRIERRGHAVVVVGEGAGQDLLAADGTRDASGNLRFRDIGLFLKDRIQQYFRQRSMECGLKYIDPSYIIRSLPANAQDSAFCLLLGQRAVHAGMAGRTDTVIGFWKRAFTHVPIAQAVGKRKRIEPDGLLWTSVLASTGQTEM